MQYTFPNQMSNFVSHQEWKEIATRLYIQIVINGLQFTIFPAQLMAPGGLVLFGPQIDLVSRGKHSCFR